MDTFMAVLRFIYTGRLVPISEAQLPSLTVEDDVLHRDVDVNLALDVIPIANLVQLDRLKVLLMHIHH
jgi:hypothetical protein